MSRTEKFVIVVFYRCFPFKVILILFELSKDLVITKESCLTGNVGFLRFETILTVPKAGEAAHWWKSWLVGWWPCWVWGASFSCTGAKLHPAKNLNQRDCKTYFICKWISINFKIKFNQITSFNILYLSLAISLCLHFALWTGDYKQEQGLNMSARLAVSVKMALYQFQLKPLNQNIFLVIFMSVFFTVIFLYLKKTLLILCE